ncbi:MAG: transpeptidase family protein [Prolixibacteraceae bacterium]|nr:transpeptidase family protein [Prolixibacteraceae bacterium]
MEIRNKIVFRLGFVYFLAVLLGIVILGKLFLVQTVDTGKWKTIIKNLEDNESVIPARRGSICADDGSILATSVPYYQLRMDLSAPRVKKVFETYSEKFSSEVSAFFNISERDFKVRLLKAYKNQSRWFLLDSKKLDYRELNKFKKLDIMSRLYFGSGLIVVGESERIMPYGDMASRTIGSLNKGIYGGNHGKIGYGGIEGMMESYLVGEKGKSIKKNLSGRWVNVPVKEPEEGKKVITTINVVLQNYIENALMEQMKKSSAEWGTAILMKVNTGEIKAIANLGCTKEGTYSEIYNYSLGHAGCGEPGSTFKLPSLMAAIEEGLVDTSDIFDTGIGKWDYKDQTIYDSDYGHGGHGAISVKKILEYSSNIGAAKVITSCYENHPKDFIDRLCNFGFNKSLNIGFAGEAVPYVKYPGDKDWWGTSLAWISFGYEIKITPLHTLTFYNAVANNGVMVKPRFISEVRENGTLVKSFDTEVINSSICSESTINKAKAMLEGVCTEGTGRFLTNPYFPIAGKTGTAQIAYQNKGYTSGGHKKYQASFVGYFPADNPKYSAIVVIVGPQGSYYGASVAGPVFKKIIGKTYATMLQYRETSKDSVSVIPDIAKGFRSEVRLTAQKIGLNIKTDGIGQPLLKVENDQNRVKTIGCSIVTGEVPDVKGMGLSDAVYLLEKEGLKVNIIGVGKVINQSVPAGNKIIKGETIRLELG